MCFSKHAFYSFQTPFPQTSLPALTMLPLTPASMSFHVAPVLYSFSLTFSLHLVSADPLPSPALQLFSVDIFNAAVPPTVNIYNLLNGHSLLQCVCCVIHALCITQVSLLSRGVTLFCVVVHAIVGTRRFISFSRSGVVPAAPYSPWHTAPYLLCFLCCCCLVFAFVLLTWRRPT